MTIKHVLFVIILLVGFELSAQDQKKSTLNSFPKIELGIRGLDIAYEHVLSPVLLVEPYMSFGKEYQIGITSQRGFVFDLGDDYLTLGSHLKLYYSLNKRLSKEKNMAHNAGNFLGAKMEYIYLFLDDEDGDNFINTSLYWGIQRPLRDQYLWGFYLGLGNYYNFDTSTFSDVSFIANIKIGLSL